MNDLFTDPKAWVLGLLTILGAAVAWFFQRELSRIDKAIAESVTRNELEQFRIDQRQEHEENKNTLREIKDGITGTHQRIDTLYRDLLGKER